MIRIPWNKYEVAILVEASLQVIENKKKRKEIICKVSENLRKMAINQGIQIDDLYRNINGISMQMTIMISVIEDKKSPLHSSPKIFNEVVALYKSNRDDYYQILNEAKQMISNSVIGKFDNIATGENDMKGCKENKFYTWLSSKVSPSQISDYFLLYQEIDNLCQNKLRVGCLFDLQDITTVKKSILNYYSYKSKAVKALSLYEEYLINSVNNSVPQNTQDTSYSLIKSDAKLIRKKRHEYTEYLKHIGKTDNIIYFLANIDMCSKIAFESNISTSQSLYLISSSDELQKILKQLEINRDFINYNVRRSHSPHHAISYLIQYMSEYAVKKNEKNSSEKNLSNNTTVITSLQSKVSDSDSNDFIIDFDNISTLSYTQPVFLRVFEKKHTELRNWTALYLTIITELYEKYPSKINSIKNHSLTSGRKDFSDELGYHTMVAPKKITNYLYVETNLSATDICKKIRKLLDLCCVSYSDIEVRYTNKENIASSSKSFVRTPQTVQQNSDIDRIKRDFSNWMQNRGFSQRTVPNYIAAINQTSQYAKRYGIFLDNLFTVEDIANLRQIFKKLMNIAAFREENIHQHNRFSAAVSQLIEYRSTSSVSRNSTYSRPNTIHIEEDRYKDIDFSPYRKILKSKYPRGFRLNDSLDIKKFRRYWNEFYGEENSLSNEVIWDYISHITIAHGKMSYLPEMMIDEETKARLFNYIDETFTSGKNAIYYEALYQMFRDEFDNGRINNAEMLKTYLEYTSKDKYFLQKAYMAVDSNAKVDPAEEVRGLLKSHEIPMMTEDIIKALPHLDKDKVTAALSGNNSYEFVRNQKGEYFHADIIEFTYREIARIEQWISDSISQNEYISSKELSSLIDRYLPEIHERYTFLTELGLRDTIAYKLKGKFSFKSKIISKYGEDLNMDEVFASFGKNHAPFSMEQLNALKDELGTNIYFDSLYRYAMRVSQNEFVSRDYADFDISATDDAIEQFCTGDFISLQDVTLFGGFPSCGYSWNSYLLEYYVMYFSRKFKLLHTNFNMNSSVGAIVRKNTGIEAFDDVIIRALAQSNITLTTDDALNYLCESGFLARRTYGTIDNIVSQAKAYRVLKGE